MKTIKLSIIFIFVSLYSFSCSSGSQSGSDNLRASKSKSKKYDIRYKEWLTNQRNFEEQNGFHTLFYFDEDLYENFERLENTCCCHIFEYVCATDFSIMFRIPLVMTITNYEINTHINEIQKTHKVLRSYPVYSVEKRYVHVYECNDAIFEHYITDSYMKIKNIIENTESTHICNHINFDMLLKQHDKFYMQKSYECSNILTKLLTSK